MQLNPQRKKLIILVAAAGLVILSGALTVYALKHQAKNNDVQQSEQSTIQAKRNFAALDMEKEADKLLGDGNVSGAKEKYQTAASLFAESNNAEGVERVKMQLSLIDIRQKNPTPETTDLTDAPVDRKLDSQLGVPPPVAQP